MIAWMQVLTKLNVSLLEQLDEDISVKGDPIQTLVLPTLGSSRTSYQPRWFYRHWYPEPGKGERFHLKHLCSWFPPVAIRNRNHN